MVRHAYIVKRERMLLMNHLTMYRKFWNSKSSSSEELYQTIDNLKLKEDSPRIKCFFDLVYGTTIHPHLEKTITSTNAYKWYVEPSINKIVIYCTDNEAVFKDSFKKEWQSFNSEYQVDDVLKMVSYLN